MNEFALFTSHFPNQIFLSLSFSTYPSLSNPSSALQVWSVRPHCIAPETSDQILIDLTSFPTIDQDRDRKHTPSKPRSPHIHITSTDVLTHRRLQFHLTKPSRPSQKHSLLIMSIAKVTISVAKKEFARLRLHKAKMSARRIKDLLARKPDNAMGHSWWNVNDNDFAFRFDIGHITPNIMRILAQRNAQAKDASLKKIDTHAVLSWWDIDLTKEPSVEMFDEGLDVLEARMTTGEEPPPLEDEGSSGSEGDGSSGSEGEGTNGSEDSQGKKKKKGKKKGKKGKEKEKEKEKKKKGKENSVRGSQSEGAIGDGGKGKGNWVGKGKKQ